MKKPMFGLVDMLDRRLARTVSHAMMSDAWWCCITQAMTMVGEMLIPSEQQTRIDALRSMHFRNRSKQTPSESSSSVRLEEPDLSSTAAIVSTSNPLSPIESPTVGSSALPVPRRITPV